MAYKLPSAPAGTSHPPAIKIDGSLDEPAWHEVAFTDSNPDICGTSDHCPNDGKINQSKYPCSDNCCTAAMKPNTCGVPRFTTKQKIRWDDEYLYIGAELEEPQVPLHLAPAARRQQSPSSLLHVRALPTGACCWQVWANNTKHNSVIFQDNDYEVCISPDGSNHYCRWISITVLIA